MVKPALVSALAAVSIAIAAHAQAMGQYIDIFPRSEEDIQLILSTLDETINTPDRTAPPIVMMLRA